MERHDIESKGNISATLTWKDLTVTITRSNGDTQNLLEGISGYAEPGSFTALMGPSGSGKSTLLHALSSRLAANAILFGSVLLNGRKANLSFGTAAYVAEQDDLIGTLTVRETISYSAQLRLPSGMPWPEKQALVESTIVEMGLQDCGDTVIGNWHLRGISGGERKRVNIALEILMKPTLLFLDEPTTGLDSAAALFITQILHGLSRGGRTVIASIHQPSGEIFEMFDRLYLLSGGKTVYFGQAAEACGFFARAGFPCPDLMNPSDHFLRCINSDFVNVKVSMEGSMDTCFPSNVEQVTTAKAIQILLDSYCTSQCCYVANLKIEEMSKFKGTILDFRGSDAGFFMQASILTKRSFVNMSRDIGYYWLRLVIYIMVSLSIGTIYFGVGTETGYNSIMARASCLSFIFGFLTFMSVGGFPSFVEDMKVFHKERLNGHYGAGAFVISNTLSAIPYLLLISVTSSAICQYMIKLHPYFSHYVYLALSLYATITAVESLMMAIASVVPNFLMGIIIGAGIQAIFMLVSGFFRLPHEIPKFFWRYPVTYLSYLYWAHQGQYQNQAGDMMIFDNFTPDLPKLTGEEIIVNMYQINVRRSKWIDLGVIFSMAIIYRIFFFFMIKVNEDIMPWVRGYITRRKLKHRIVSSNAFEDHF